MRLSYDARPAIVSLLEVLRELIVCFSYYRYFVDPDISLNRLLILIEIYDPIDELLLVKH